MTRRCTPLFLLAMALGLGAAAPAWAVTPTEVLETFFGQTNAIIRSVDLTQGVEAPKREIRGLVSGVFDYREAASWALGPMWQTRTAVQQNEFVTLFAGFIEKGFIAAIGTKASLAGGMTIQFLGETIKGDAATVSTTLLTRNGTELPVDYSMVRRGDRWMVRDVVIDGMSLVANYRSQFARILRASSYAGLLARLRGDLAEAAEMPATAPAPVAAAPAPAAPPASAPRVAQPAPMTVVAPAAPAAPIVAQPTSPVAAPAPPAVAQTFIAPPTPGVPAPAQLLSGVIHAPPSRQELRLVARAGEETAPKSEPAKPETVKAEPAKAEPAASATPAVGAPIVASSAEPAPAAEKPAEKAPEKIVEKVAEKVVAAPKAAAAATYYWVQVGAFKTADAAVQLAKRLRGLGIAASNGPLAAEPGHAAGALARVRVGPFASRAEAVQKLRELVSHGYTPFIAEARD